ncbi:MAG: CRTAC1 family protein [Pseudomonadota bacterium]
MRSKAGRDMLRPAVLAVLGVVVPAVGWVDVQAQAPDTVRFERLPIPDHQYLGGWHHFVGGGVAVFDCDGDDYPELVVAGGDAPAKLLRNRTRAAGDTLRFAIDTPTPVGRTGVTGVYPVDIDSDGHQDLVLLRVGPDTLLRGLGDCVFDEAPAVWGFQSPDLWSTAFSATFEAGASLPTLAIGTYVDRHHPEGPFGQCSETLLYRPAGERYAEPRALAPGHCALSMLFTDWSRSGRADLRVSNDRHYYVRDGREQMWAMEPEPRLYRAEEGWRDFALWGMGIASRDLNQDGYNDVMLTSIGDQKLQFHEPDAAGPVYRNAPFEFGASAHRPYTGGDGRPSTGWHAAFGDVQNDGLDDLFIAKGNVDQMPDAALKDPNNLLVQRENGRFVELGAEAGVASTERGRGAALVDLNRDGLLDIVVNNRRAPLELYQNRSAGNHWLRLNVSQPGRNPEALGAYIEVRGDTRWWSREITRGGGHAGGDAVPMHLGLGDAASVDVRVVWPDQSVSTWHRVDASQSLHVARDGPGLRIEPY